jgi:hypothetical protein
MVWGEVKIMSRAVAVAAGCAEGGPPVSGVGLDGDHALGGVGLLQLCA